MKVRVSPYPLVLGQAAALSSLEEAGLLTKGGALEGETQLQIVAAIPMPTSPHPPEMSFVEGKRGSPPPHLQQDSEIQELSDLYQQQLAELTACHSLLIADQERLAAMLAPYVSASGELKFGREGPDPRVILFKQGLDLRLREFQEDCGRIQTTEERLQRKIEEAASDYESTFLGLSGLADARVMRRLKELRREMKVQQLALDQRRFEIEVLRDENRRLRHICKYAPDYEHLDGGGKTQKRPPLPSPPPFPSLHQQMGGKAAPSGWAGRGTMQPSYRKPEKNDYKASKPKKWVKADEIDFNRGRNVRKGEGGGRDHRDERRRGQRNEDSGRGEVYKREKGGGGGGRGRGIELSPPSGQHSRKVSEEEPGFFSGLFGGGEEAETAEKVERSANSSPGPRKRNSFI